MNHYNIPSRQNRQKQSEEVRFRHSKYSAMLSNIHSYSVISSETKAGEGHSWHNLLPICAVSDNRKIILYDMELMH